MLVADRWFHENCTFEIRGGSPMNFINHCPPAPFGPFSVSPPKKLKTSGSLRCEESFGPYPAWQTVETSIVRRKLATVGFFLEVDDG